MAADYFWSIKKQIEEEYHLLSLGLSAFSDEDLSETLYKRFSGQIDYLQTLFDNISEESKNLDLDPSNPELYKLLEAKQAISDCYGQFNRQKNIFYKRFAKFRSQKEEDRFLDRSEPDSEPEPEEDILEALPEDLPEVVDLEADLDPEAERAAKTAERKARQEKLAADAKRRDAQYQANRLRQEEAARLGFLVHPDQPVSEADIQHERIRQEEQRQQEAARETARIQEENEALRRTQARMEQAEHFERVQSSHIDMSREGIGQHTKAPESPEYDVTLSTEPLASTQQTPSHEIPANHQPEVHTAPAQDEQRPAEQPRYEERFTEPSGKPADRPSDSFPHGTLAPEYPSEPEKNNPISTVIPASPQNEFPRSSYREDVSQQSHTHEDPNFMPAPDPVHPFHQEELRPDVRQPSSSGADGYVQMPYPDPELRHEQSQTQREPDPAFSINPGYIPRREEFRPEDHQPFSSGNDSHAQTLRPDLDPQHAQFQVYSESSSVSAAQSGYAPHREEVRPVEPPSFAGDPYNHAQMPRTDSEPRREQSQVHSEPPSASAVNPGFIPRREEPRPDEQQFAAGDRQNPVQIPHTGSEPQRSSEQAPHGVRPSESDIYYRNRDRVPERPSEREMSSWKHHTDATEKAFSVQPQQSHPEAPAESHFSKDSADLHHPHPTSFSVHTPGMRSDSPGMVKPADIPKSPDEATPVHTTAGLEQPNAPYGYDSRDGRYGPHFRPTVYGPNPTVTPLQFTATAHREPTHAVQDTQKGVPLKEQGSQASGGFIPYQFTPAGITPVTAFRRELFDKSADHNAQIYSALMANRSENNAEVIQVSPALETQMRFNVERARMACADTKGTEAAPAAVHEYIEQRNALARYRSAIREGKIRVSDPPILKSASDKEPTSAVASSIPSKVGNGAAAVYAFTPTGITAKTIDHGKPTGNSYVFQNKGLPQKLAYTPANPMIVTGQYEEAITKKMRKATESLDAAIASGEPKAHSVNPQEVKMYTDAYLAFQKAKRDGTVIVSENGEGHNEPDYFSWQQQRLAQKMKAPAAGGVSGNLFSGVTGQSLGPNPNQPQKKTVEETSSNLFNRGSLLKRQSLATIYAKQLGTRFQYWSTGAAYSLSRHMYHLVQTGEDNALRTMETGRYYMMTATGVVLVVASTAPVEKLGQRLADSTSREFRMFGTKSFLTKSELSAAVNNGLRTTRELDAQISGIEAQLAPLKAKMQTSSLDKYSQRQFDKLSNQLEQLKGERASAGKSLSLHQKLKSLRNEAKMEEELYKMLEKDGALPKNAKKLRKSAGEINSHFQAEMKIKYEGHSFVEKGKRIPLLKASDKSLKAEIADIKLSGRNLKARIKALEAKGSLLTQKERRLLMDLKAETKRLGQELGRLESLSRDRAKLAFWNKKLDSMIKNASKNWERARGGLFALQGFMLRPLQVGAESNTDGLAAAIRISSNRYVHFLVKKSFKASMFLTKGSMNLLAPGSVQAMENTVFIAKTVVRAQTGLASNAIKTSVRTGVRAVGNAISSAVPTGIKTGVKTVVSAGSAVKNKYRGIVNSVKKIANDTKVWFYKTRVGRGVSAVARFNKSSSEAIKAALSLLKGAALKGVAIFAVIFVLIGLMSLGFGMSASMAGGSIIASPNTSENGKVDLSPYMEIISREQTKFQNRIDGYMKDKKYDKVYLNYSGPMTNTKHMLSMMAVRMNQNLDLEKNPEIEEYLVSLFEDSHKISLETVDRYCSGCKQKEQYVIEWNPELRVYDYVYVWDEKKEEYVRKTEIVEYCDGHTDLYIDVSVLVFDEIFTADSYGNAGQSANAGQKIGNFKITYYCIENYPHICNDGDASNTATGTVPTPGRTIAVDPDVIPLGSHVIIDGHEYIAEDTGGAINGKRIDIVVAKHKEALEKGTRYNVPVYYPSYEGGSYEKTGKWDGWTEDNIEWCKVIYNMPWHALYTGYFEFGSVIDSGELAVSGDFMWPVSCTHITSPFGPRKAPVAGASTFHKGVDIGVGTGTPVHAAADGKVIVSAYDSAAGYYMVIDHGNGIVTRYLHNSVLNFNVGDTVRQGDIVTYSGATGIGTGAHLHFEFIVNGTPIDPCVQFKDVSFTGNWNNPYG